MSKKPNENQKVRGGTVKVFPRELFLNNKIISDEDDVLLSLTNISTSQQGLTEWEKKRFKQIIKWRRAEMIGKPFKTRAKQPVFCKNYRVIFMKYCKGMLKYVTFTKLPCNSWTCPVCQLKKALSVKYKLRNVILINDLKYFLTLTLDPKKIPKEFKSENYNFTHRYITKLYNHFLSTLNKKAFNYFDEKQNKWIKFDLKSELIPLMYVWVIEFQKNGNAHLHILLNKRIPVEVIRAAWTYVGGGHIMKVEEVKNINAISIYLTDYIVKGIKNDSTNQTGFKYYEKRYQISKYCVRPKKYSRGFFKEFGIKNLSKKDVQDGLKLYNLDWINNYLYNPDYIEQTLLINTALTDPK